MNQWYPQHPQAALALSLATLAFAVNFAVWMLYAVLALDFQNNFNVASTLLGFILAAPILSGSLLRIPAGFLADRFSPKRLFVAQMLLTSPSLFILPLATTIEHYVLLGLWIGISGCSFTIGIRYICDWYERAKLGSAMGIFGAGNAGAAITLATAPLLMRYGGLDYIGPLYGSGLIFVAIVFAAFAPQYRSSPAHSNIPKSRPTWIFKLQVWRFGLYYFFVFGSFIALVMWLPQYYVNAYDTSVQLALALTLAYATSSSLVRALGGWFADRYGGRAVNWSVFWICLGCLFILSYPPTTMQIHGINKIVHLRIEISLTLFTILILVIGIAQGFGRASVYKIIHDYYPNKMGEVGGFVAALGGLGGAVLPLAFGIAVDWVGVYSASFMLLYGVLALCMITMFFAIKADQHQLRLKRAIEHNFLEPTLLAPEENQS